MSTWHGILLGAAHCWYSCGANDLSFCPIVAAVLPSVGWCTKQCRETVLDDRMMSTVYNPLAVPLTRWYPLGCETKRTTAIGDDHDAVLPIDRHANHCVVAVLDEGDNTVNERRIPNALAIIVEVLRRYGSGLSGRALDSTCNWYRLVDGLMEAGLMCIWRIPGPCPSSRAYYHMLSRQEVSDVQRAFG